MALVRWEPAREATRCRPRSTGSSTRSSAQGGNGATGAGFRRWTWSRPRTTSCSRPTCPGSAARTSRSRSRTACSPSPVSAAPSTRRSRRATTGSSGRSARFSRSLTLPKGVDADSVAADFDRRRARGPIPKPEERKPHRVEIAGGERRGHRERAEVAPASRLGSCAATRSASIRDHSSGRSRPDRAAPDRPRAGRNPAFIPLATRGAVRTLDVGEVAGLGFELILGNTFHLFLAPGPSGSPRSAACTGSSAGSGR